MPYFFQCIILLQKKQAISAQQSHFFNANALRVGLPFSSFIGPATPPILAQKLLRRAAALGDFAASLADTGGFSLEPVVLL
jgi:hypothetical protein